MIGWNPQQDITIWELAMALPLVINAGNYTPAQQLAALNALPVAVSRHFTRP